MNIPGKILITGGNGLIGRILTSRLTEKGYQVAVLARNSVNDIEIPVFQWNPEKRTIDQEALRGVGCIIHLAGAGIGDKRWTSGRKREIVDSRVDTAGFLLNEIKKRGIVPEIFISSSATGYYGTNTTFKTYTEPDPAAGDFLGETCRLWEEAADRFAETGARVIKIRTGIVLSRKGGALPKMAGPLKFGFSPVFGNGEQWLPWIHGDDLCDLYIKVLEDPFMTGAFNGVAPQSVTNRDFMREVAEALGKPFIPVTIPSFSLKWIFGEMSSVLLEGSRVSCEKILKAGFDFRFPMLKDALEDIYK